MVPSKPSCLEEGSQINGANVTENPSTRDPEQSRRMLAPALPPCGCENALVMIMQQGKHPDIVDDCADDVCCKNVFEHDALGTNKQDLTRTPSSIEGFSGSSAFIDRAEPLKSTKSLSWTSQPDAALLDAPATREHYAILERFVREKGGRYVISRILIANNGNAAVKAIRSLRQWTLAEFGTERLLEFVVLATPDDIEGNAEYISEGDFLVEVSEGPSENNYGSIPLIVQIAEEHDCDAVWPGWGHASENFRFPLALEASVRRPIWIGPPASAMIALGDKIGSTIIAQSVGLRCLPWSGSDVRCDISELSGTQGFRPSLIALGSVRSAAEVIKVCERTGYPVMIKASAGGGGRGIRKVYCIEEVEAAFRQVVYEVKNSPVFVMGLLEHCRHLEVQVVGDRFGSVVALGSRDCTVQRRCQKLIEESPVLAAPPHVIEEMETGAVKLCAAVGYTSVATCEFLYDLDTGKVYFLEVNARLQVEHVVTEVVNQINLPAIQLQTAFGLPLSQISSLQSLAQKKSDCHCIAARVTAEHAEDSFRPTCGQVFEIHFRSSLNVWAYFSLGVTGKVHHFADSQIGHVFASGKTREEARCHLLMALRRLTIRGEIRTNVEALTHILELPEFIRNTTHTAWVERCVQFDRPEDGGVLTPDTPPACLPASRRVGTKTLLAVLLAAAYESFLKFKQSESDFTEKIRQGQLPPVIQGSHSLELVYRNIRFSLKCYHTGPCTISVVLNDSSSEVLLRPISLSCISASGTGSPRRCGRGRDDLTSSACFLVSGGPDGRSRRVFYKIDAGGTCVTFDGSTFTFTKETDPTQVRAPVSGRLSRWLVPNGTPVHSGQTYAEIEIMKMYMQLQVSDAGILSHALAEGAVFKIGDLLATLELPEGAVPEKAEEYTEPHPFNVFEANKNESQFRQRAKKNGTTRRISAIQNPLREIRQAQDFLVRAMSGYYCTPSAVKSAFARCLQGLLNPSLPVYEILDVLTSLELQLPSDLVQRLHEIAGAEHYAAEGASFCPLQKADPPMSLCVYSTTTRRSVELSGGNGLCCTERATESKIQPVSTHRAKLACEVLENFLFHQCAGSPMASPEKTVLTQAQLEPLSQLLQKHQRGLLVTAADVFIGLLTQYLDIEEMFHQYDGEAASKLLLLKRTEMDPDRLAAVARSHQALSQKNDLVVHLLGILRHRYEFSDVLPFCHDALQRLSNLTKSKYAAVSLRARQLLLARRQRPFVERTLALIDNFTDYLERRRPHQGSGSGSQAAQCGSSCWCSMSHHGCFVHPTGSTTCCPASVQHSSSLHHALAAFHHMSQHHPPPLACSLSASKVILPHRSALRHHQNGMSPPIKGSGSVGATPVANCPLFFNAAFSSTGVSTCSGCGSLFNAAAAVGGGTLFEDLGSLFTQTFAENLEDAADDSLIALLAHPNLELCKVALEVYVRRHYERCGLHDLRVCCAGDIWWKQQPFTFPTTTHVGVTEERVLLPRLGSLRYGRASVPPTNAKLSCSASSSEPDPSIAVPPISAVPWSSCDHSTHTANATTPSLIWRPTRFAAAAPLSPPSQRPQVPATVEVQLQEPPGTTLQPLAGSLEPTVPCDDGGSSLSLQQVESFGAFDVETGVQKVNRLLATWMCSALLSYEFLTSCCDVITEGRLAYPNLPTEATCFSFNDIVASPTKENPEKRQQQQPVEKTISLFANHAESYGRGAVTPQPPEMNCACSSNSLPSSEKQEEPTEPMRLGLDSDSRLHHMLNAFASPGSDLHEANAGKLQMVVAMAFETFADFQACFVKSLNEYAELQACMPAAPPTADGKVLLIFISEMNQHTLLQLCTTNVPTNYSALLEAQCKRHSIQLAQLGFNLVGFSFLTGCHLKDLNFDNAKRIPTRTGQTSQCLSGLKGLPTELENDAAAETKFQNETSAFPRCLSETVNDVNGDLKHVEGDQPELVNEQFSGDFDLVCSSIPRYLYFRNLAALPLLAPSSPTPTVDISCRDALQESMPPPVTARFVEEAILRNVGCPHFGQLELKRLVHFNVKVEPSSIPHIHLFEAVPKVNHEVPSNLKVKSNRNLLKKPNVKALARFFVRILLHYQLSTKDDDWSELERYLVASLNALELALKSKSPRGQRHSPSHHILMNVILQGPSRTTNLPPVNASAPTQPCIVKRISPSVAESTALALARRYEQRLMNNGVDTLEVRFAQRSFQASDTFVPIRIVITNPTRQALQVQKFVEITDPTTGELIYSALDASDSLAISVRQPNGGPKPYYPSASLGARAGRPTKERSAETSARAPSETPKCLQQLSGFHPVLGKPVNLGSGNRLTWQKESVYDGLPVNTPHPLTGPLEGKRALAASVSTIYIYDFLGLFEEAIKKQWQSCPKYFIPVFPGSDGTSLSDDTPTPTEASSDRSLVQPTAFIPDKVLEYAELTLDHRAEVVEVVREPGHNECGMVAWRVLMRTPEFPRGRRVILIGNDVTFQMGTFGVQEDLLFQRVSELARKEGVPRIYIAVNSGARMGLATEVQKALQVEWVDPADPAKGFKYLYVTEEDYRRLQASESIAAEPVIQPSTNTCVYRLTSVIGSEVGLGVENLCGSGAIAGETSRAYKSNVTITFVTGRTVGIGAYITRLGQRVIQKASQAPILLTGYQAINRLIGRDVYSSNDELGGVDVMARNGVTHIVVGNDIEGCEEIVRWLSYVPEHTEGALPIMVDPTDPISRPVLFTVSSLTEDPRLMLTGCTDAKGRWLGGIFDRGSFREVLADWAKSVILGRARLGGIPVGVIAVETRVTETVFPADPAVSDSSEMTLLRAGQLWFPDSAYKTAQGISDFNREELPLFIFANWRGFSGGQRDMFYEVLKFGSFIVDALVDFKQPCFVYIPPKAELRGGAWVVVDPRINSNYMDMFADPDSRGGVLEPTGTVEIKLRTAALAELAERLDTSLQQMLLKDQHLAGEGVALDDPRRALLKEARDKRLQDLLPVYKQVAVHFADLHDTATRMKRRAAVHDVVPWERSRTYFYWRLRRQLIFFNLRTEILKANPTLHMADAEQLIYRWAEASGHAFQGLRSSSLTAACALNAKFVQWACHALSDISRRLASLRRDYHRSQVFSLLRKSPYLLPEVVHQMAPHLLNKHCEAAPPSEALITNEDSTLLPQIASS